MTVFLRLTLVGLFIALGVALAFCVVCSTAPSRSRLPDGPPPTVGQIANPSGNAADLVDGLPIRPAKNPAPVLSPTRSEAAETLRTPRIDGDELAETIQTRRSDRNEA